MRWSTMPACSPRPPNLPIARAAELAPGYPAPRFFYGLALAALRASATMPQRCGSEVLADAPAEASWRPLVEDAVAALRRPAPAVAR